jgi:hypothetical protein
MMPEPEPKTLGTPTPHPPGSLEKIAVLKYRFDHHQILFHPEDANFVEGSKIEPIRVPLGYKKYIKNPNRRIAYFS